MRLADNHTVTGTVTGCDRNEHQLGAQEMVDRMIYVIARLEEAGSSLLALPGSGYGTGIRVGSLDVVREAVEAYGYVPTVVRAAPPTAGAITRMDEALAWLGYIDLGHPLVRHIVGARCLVNPLTGRHLFSWRRLGVRYGLHKDTVAARHIQGIEVILSRLHRSGFIFPG